MRPGPRNLITDVAGLHVGSASDARLRTGVTVITADRPFVAAVHVAGGAPGTRETDLLDPLSLVQEVDALVLSGGSAWGLAAADGVMAGLRDRGRGLAVLGSRVPIVPAAIVFDLAGGGEIGGPGGWAGDPAYGRPNAPGPGDVAAQPGTTAPRDPASAFPPRAGDPGAGSLAEGGVPPARSAGYPTPAPNSDPAPNPYPALGRRALDAAGADFALGTAGAGTGATTSLHKGGLGSASARLAGGGTVGALVVVNAVGQVTATGAANFLAAPWEEDGEFGGLGSAPRAGDPAPTKPEARAATVIAAVATDRALTRVQAGRVALMARDGIARAVQPAHTPFDGDLVFAAATGHGPPATDLELISIGHAAATCLARAIARAVFCATPAAGDPRPAWCHLHGPPP